MNRFVGAILLLWTGILSFPTVGYVDERDEQSVTSITQCILKDEAVRAARYAIDMNIGSLKRDWLATLEELDKLFEIVLLEYGKEYRIVLRAEDCPKDTSIYHPIQND